MQLYIKNMVCNRCIKAVESLLQQLHLPYSLLQLGQVTLTKNPTTTQLSALREALEKAGFSLLDNTPQKLIENIKTIIIEQVHYNKYDERYNFSALLSSKLHKDYSYLSHLFSQVEGITIEKYIINQKIERAKELLVYNETSLSQIAFELGYSNVAHLSAQFKKVTGLTPTHFKTIGAGHRKTLDNI